MSRATYSIAHVMFKMDDVDEGMEPQQINVGSSFSSFKEFKERLKNQKSGTESESSHVVFTEEFTSRCTQDTSISGVAEVQSICTQYAADLMVEQMKLALTIEYTVQILLDATTVISYKSHSHSVSPKDGTCSCTF